MDKAPDAFRTISEVSELLETPAHVLRFWESRFTQIKPVKRAGGRRYYRPEDIALLGAIKRLLHDDGMTIRGVQKILRELGVRAVSAYSEPGAEPLPVGPAARGDQTLAAGAGAARPAANGAADPGGPPQQFLLDLEAGESAAESDDSVAMVVAKLSAQAGPRPVGLSPPSPGAEHQAALESAQPQADAVRPEPEQTGDAATPASPPAVSPLPPTEGTLAGAAAAEPQQAAPAPAENRSAAAAAESAPAVPGPTPLRASLAPAPAQPQITPTGTLPEAGAPQDRGADPLPPAPQTYAPMVPPPEVAARAPREPVTPNRSVSAEPPPGTREDDGGASFAPPPEPDVPVTASAPPEPEPPAASAPPEAAPRMAVEAGPVAMLPPDPSSIAERLRRLDPAQVRDLAHVFAAVHARLAALRQSASGAGATSR